MADGVVVESGKPTAIFEHPQQERTQNSYLVYYNKLIFKLR